MLIDMHMHTSERSGCASSPAVDQLMIARMTGLDAVAITDHHRLVTPAARAVLEGLFPELILIPGVEITLSDVLEDIIVLGLDHQELVDGPWDWADLRSFVRERGGLTIMAHPLRYADTIGLDLDALPPDAMELYSTNIRPANHAQIKREAEARGIPLVSSSDAHHCRDVGRHATRLREPATTVNAILEAIRCGEGIPEYRGVH